MKTKINPYLKKILISSLFVNCYFFYGCGYQVEIFAGSGKAGFLEAMGINAQFNSPRGITIDKNGNLFVADTGNCKIRKITSEGIVSTFAGTGEKGNTDGNATSAKFESPEDLVFDSNGNLFITDVFNIRKITPEGIVSTFTGNNKPGFNDGVGSEAQFNSLTRIAIDKSNNIYVIDTENNALRIVSNDRKVTTYKSALDPGFYYYSIGLDIDNNNNIYLSVKDNSPFYNNLFKFQPGNKPTSFLNINQFKNPQGLTLDTKGNIYVDTGKIIKFAPDGKNLTEITEIMERNYSNEYIDLAIDNERNILYISDDKKNQISKILLK